MSVGTKLLQAAAGNAGETVYVDDLFSCFLYEGNATSRNIVNGIDLADKGGLVWTKNRDDTYDHNFVDSARGLTNSPYIRSNTTGSQGTDGGGITVFNSDGYTVGNSGSWNANGNSHVSWTFAKQEKFFDIVTYTGDGTDNRAIAHNLGSVPGMIIVKVTSHTDNWIVYHRSLGYTKLLRLNMTNAAWTQDRWGDQNPTSTHFYVDNNAECNQSSYTYVAYLFAHDEQDFGEDSDEAIIKCGIYSGNSAGSATTDQTITLGFEPQWIMIKKALNGIGRWSIFDNMRGVFVDSPDKHLSADVSNAEESDDGLRFDPTGFTLEGANWNYTDGSTAHEYIYMAIARPHKPASEFAATDLFAVANATTNAPLFVSGFPVDGGFYHITTNTKAMYIGSRLQGTKYMLSYTPATEVTNNDHKWDFMDGWYDNSFASTDYVSYMFRRAKGFFDIVAYDGTGSDRTQAHNLGIAPELILIKRRGPSNADWVWYVGSLGAGKYMYGDAGAELSSTTIWSNTAPTASVFSLGNQSGSTYRVNGSGSTYVAYLFATVDGVSKIGTYTGNDADQTIDCGFSNGAKFILIKRTDSSGNWYVLDSVRGLSTGSDPWFELNSAAVDQTGNMINVRSSGFGVSAGAGSGGNSTININGASYIFLAIA